MSWGPRRTTPAESQLERMGGAADGMSDLPGDYSPDGTQLVFKRTSEEADGPLMIVDVGRCGEPQGAE